MPRAHIELDKQAVIAPVRRRTSGSFLEHLGRCVYTGLYEPDREGTTVVRVSFDGRPALGCVLIAGSRGPLTISVAGFNPAISAGRTS